MVDPIDGTEGDDEKEGSSLSVKPNADYTAPGGLSIGQALGTYEQRQGALSEQGAANLALLNKAMEDLRAQRVGPSKSEKWLALAAALGQPTKTGAFGETLGNVAQTLGKYKAAGREAEQEKQNLLMKYGLEIGTERYKQLQDAANQAGQVYRTVAQASKPRLPQNVGTQIIDGKIVAISRNPDTGEYIKEVLGDAAPDLKPTNLTFQGQPVFNSNKGPVLADGTPVTQFDEKKTELSSTELREIFKTEDALNTGLSTINSLEQALALSDRAFEGSLSEWRKTAGRFLNSNDPAYIATEDFDNLQIASAIGNLKNIFPGAISNDERKAFNDLQAVSKYPREVRSRIINRALAAAKSLVSRETARLERLKRGDYSRRSGTPTQQPSPPRVLNWGK